jgi:hypothetical protein
MLKFLDLFFTVFHSLVILFNFFGWIWKPLRKWNLGLLIITGGSWFILGIFYGIGYCPLTDWHWQVLNKLGVSSLPGSYTSYLLERVTGFRITDAAADDLTMGCFLAALLISIFLNFRDKRKKKAESCPKADKQ